MRIEIATRLLMKGGAGMLLGPEILGMPLPRFQMPETFVIEEKKS